MSQLSYIFKSMSMHKESIKGREFLHPGSCLLYYFSHHTAGLLNVAIEKSQNYSDWICTESCFLIWWLLTILLLTPYPIFYDSIFTPSSTSAKALTSGLTEINVCKCGLLGELSSWSSCFHASQEWIVLEQHFLFPPSLLTLIHEDEWLSWLLVQVDSNIHSFTFFYWEGWMFQFTAPFAYSSSVCSRVACSQHEHIIFSPSYDNLLGWA